MWSLFLSLLMRTLSCSKTLMQNYCVGIIDSTILVLESSKYWQSFEWCQKGYPLWCLQNVLIYHFAHKQPWQMQAQAIFAFFPSHHQLSVFSLPKWFLWKQVLSDNWRDGWQLEDKEFSWCSWIIFHASGTYSYKKCYVSQDSQTQNGLWSTL